MRLALTALVPLAVLATAILGGCQRGADEAAPASASPPVVSASASSSVPSGRCVVPTPETAPPVPPPAARCPPDPNPHPLDLVSVRFPEATKGEAVVAAELARKPADKEKGLMFRTSMDDGHGMLFDLGSHQVQTFWMRNTCIPLDMIFLDEDGFVVGIVENAPTLNDAPRSIPCDSSYVLEVNAGWSRRVGVRAGSRARLPGA